MTAPLRSTPHASALPASQTAPVAEFRCLFTHDVRRKQKRWQDGYLKFHTFNNRVMVCDQARNHVGDTYWKESNELHEGDELSLDKGVLVEVAEAMGITQTDLAPILAKKTKTPTKEPPMRPTPSATVRPFQRPSSVAPNNAARAASQLRHKSLNSLLGTPKGPVGKAAPIKSPYEARMEKEKENDLAEERAPKRQRIMQRPAGWRASSPVQGDEQSPIKTTALREGASDTRSGPTAAHVITIPSESDHIPFVSSGVTLPGTPAKLVRSVSPPSVTSAPAVPVSVLPAPQSMHTPKPPRAKITLPKSKPVETPTRPPPTSSPPVSASNRLTNIDFAVQPVHKPQKQPSPPPSLPPNPKAKSLRLSAGVKRATLMCQSMPRPASRAGIEAKALVSKPNSTRTSQPRSKEPSPTLSGVHGTRVGRDDPVISRQSPPVRGKRKSPPTDTGKRLKKAKAMTPPFVQQADVFDDPEVTHGLMDQQLLVASSPIESHQPLPSPARRAPVPKPKANAAQNADSTKGMQKRTAPEAPEQDSSRRRLPVFQNSTTKVPSVQRAAEKPQASSMILPPQSPCEAPTPRSREASPAHTDGSGARSRIGPTSVNKPVFSTGGFVKKPKRITKKTAVASPTPEVPKLAAQNDIVAPSPHSLHTGKNGSLMSTTELAALLSKPKKRTRNKDHIQDDPTHPPEKSPARKIRRVRSENDAPIPSTAEDWEKRNLPKTSSSNITEAETSIPVPEAKKKVSALAALVKRTDPRRRIQRTQSLVVDTNLEVEDVILPSPVLDKDVGPWSTEAFDLFDWRPPVRESEHVNEE